ncbi:MAG: sensor domain-containing protein [Eubacteriales bacterium]
MARSIDQPGQKAAEIKLMEQALHLAEERFSKVFKASPVPMAITSFRDGRFIDINESFLNSCSFRHDEVIGCTAVELKIWSKSDRVRVIKILKEQGAVHNLELNFRSKSGELCLGLYSAEIIGLKGEKCILSIITGRKQAEKLLRESEKRYRNLVENINDVIFTLDTNGCFTYISTAIEKVFHYKVDDIIGKPFACFVHPEDLPGFTASLEQVLNGKLEPYRFRMLDKDGTVRHVRTSGRPLFEDNQMVGLTGTIVDITDRRQLEDELKKHLDHFEEMVKDRTAELKKANEQLQREMTERKIAEKALRESEEKYRIIFRTTGTAVIIIEEDTTISLANEEFEILCGYSKSDVEGKVSWKQFFEPEYVDRMVEYHYKRRADRGAAPKSYETRFIDRHGNVKDVLVSVSIIPGTRKSIASFVDISNIKQGEAQLKYLATHDYLTSIPNRYSFEESLKKAVAKAKRGRESALLFLDIDNFKLVNDTKGHAAGDDLLIRVANSIKENLRESDFLARLGGDEFGVMLEEATIDEARLVAEKLRQIIEEKDFWVLKHGCFNLSLSIGVVMIDGALNSQRLLSLADTALYSAKEKGRNRVVMIDPDEEITVKFAEINHLVAQVKNAVKEDSFVLHFQPVVRVANGKTIHYEVLIRMKGEDGRLISPQAFIPAAERFGLMPQVDRWVVGESLEVLRRHPGLNLFINISGASLSEESLLVYIEEIIKRCGLDPSRMGFEITETAAVKDMVLARRWIERLKKLGCQFALDDFGIGLSSFSYLRMLPVDYLKIDGSFIRNLDKDPSHRALVDAMSTVARSLGKKAVAEYVESEEILKILKELKVDCAQGYYLGFPAAIIELQTSL